MLLFLLYRKRAGHVFLSGPMFDGGEHAGGGDRSGKVDG
jgi:hypothetical protein